MSVVPIAATFVGSFLTTLVVAGVARRALARPTWRRAGGAAWDAVAQAVPDHLTLMPARAEPWRDAAAAGRLVLAFERLGFRSAGVFGIAELPGAVAQLFAHPERHFVGVVHERPRLGRWIEIVELRSDGSSTTWTTARDSGLAQRPGHPRVHAPGATPEALFERALRERGPAPAVPIHVAEAEAIFERAYAEESAWRKRRAAGRGEPRDGARGSYPAA